MLILPLSTTGEPISFCWHLAEFLFSLLFKISAIFSLLFSPWNYIQSLLETLSPASPLMDFLCVWFIVIVGGGGYYYYYHHRLDIDKCQELDLR